jgi:hypothetical protein
MAAKQRHSLACEIHHILARYGIGTPRALGGPKRSKIQGVYDQIWHAHNEPLPRRIAFLKIALSSVDMIAEYEYPGIDRDYLREHPGLYVDGLIQRVLALQQVWSENPTDFDAIMIGEQNRSEIFYGVRMLKLLKPELGFQFPAPIELALRALGKNNSLAEEYASEALVDSPLCASMVRLAQSAFEAGDLMYARQIGVFLVAWGVFPVKSKGTFWFLDVGPSQWNLSNFALAWYCRDVIELSHFFLDMIVDSYPLSIVMVQFAKVFYVVRYLLTDPLGALRYLSEIARVEFMAGSLMVAGCSSLWVLLRSRILYSDPDI